MNWSSPKSREKFSSPAKVMGVAPSQWRNARMKAKMIGPSVKTAKPMKFGAMKLYATMFFLSCLFMFVLSRIAIKGGRPAVVRHCRPPREMTEKGGSVSENLGYVLVHFR